MTYGHTTLADNKKIRLRKIGEPVLTSIDNSPIFLIVGGEFMEIIIGENIKIKESYVYHLKGEYFEILFK